MEKRKYIQPAVMAENFMLSTSIASCANVMNATDMACIEEHFEGELILSEGGFISDFSCATDVDKQEYDGYCYHTLQGQNLMTS